MEPPEDMFRAFPGADFPESDLSEEGTEIITEDTRWNRHVPESGYLIARVLNAVSAAGCLSEPDTIVLSSDREVRRLNGRFRGRRKPTNVLTFDPVPGYSGGEIVLALETVCREAAAAGRTPAAHLAHLLVHGLLHLDGYDHHQAGEARRMEMKEAWILSRIGIANPWKTRTAARNRS
ncbi:rRNA maturation RNase YbeY [Acetobacter sp. AN02]|uniref:rRNA maturation RNase YbeY n=1 Tax=Acetobacter sp. AN02 TaxID=2894186 RepID=UPI0024342E54|nr:rRNA maturation RNase YbeY [Acetobacter sp. AN02]MDG6095031.1 rRNA maturation RNase YbeY [Acetobacter sp. AN02]